MAENVAGTAQGRKYGYSFNNWKRRKMEGNCSAGCESAPPITVASSAGGDEAIRGYVLGPRVPPVDQAIGM